MKRLLPALFTGECIFQIEERETWIAKLLVVPVNPLLHKLFAFFEFCSKAFTFGLYDDNLVYLLFIVSLDEQEVGYIFANVAPASIRLGITADFKLCQRVVTIEIDFKTPSPAHYQSDKEGNDKSDFFLDKDQSWA